MRSMMRILLLSAVMAGMGTCSTARADGGCGAYGYGFFPWFGYGNSGPAAYALGNIPAPPYFALHPPVYYSQPVARPYGHSPFACPHGCPYHAIPRARRIYVNPFVERQPAVEPAAAPAPAENSVAVISKRVAVPMTRIVNPYYGSDLREEASLAQQ